MLTVVYSSILQHKLVFVMQHGTFTDSFAVGVIARDWVNWLQQISLFYSESAKFNIISYDYLHLNPQLLCYVLRKYMVFRSL